MKPSEKMLDMLIAVHAKAHLPDSERRHCLSTSVAPRYLQGVSIPHGDGLNMDVKNGPRVKPEGCHHCARCPEATPQERVGVPKPKLFGAEKAL
eukprot:scaffold176288_cov15-Tisochrysis_lutea.AAC.1